MIKKFKLLLVEDNELNLKLIEIFTNKCGYDYDSAVNGEIALNLFKSNKYDLILMDIRMPDIDGMEVVRIMRKIEKDNGLIYTPIIAVSAQSRYLCYQDCIDSGMDGYLSKPFTLEEFNESVKSFLKHKKNQKY